MDIFRLRSDCWRYSFCWRGRDYCGYRPSEREAAAAGRDDLALARLLIGGGDLREVE